MTAWASFNGQGGLSSQRCMTGAALYGTSVVELAQSRVPRLWRADRLTFQAREVGHVLPLHILEGCKKLFRSFREQAISVQPRDDLALPGYVPSAVADMPADHLQLVFLSLVHTGPTQAHAGAGR